VKLTTTTTAGSTFL